MHNDPSSRERLIRRHHEAGDLAAATTLLLDAYAPEIYRLLLSRLRERALAEEAFSEFAHDLWRGFAGFQWKCSARVWAYTVARHAMLRCVSNTKRRKLHEVPLSDLDVQCQLEARLPTRTSPALATRSRERMAELCRQLPEADQRLLALRLTQRLEWRQIAVAMNGDRETTSETLATEAARLRKRFQLIKGKLRSQLELGSGQNLTAVAPLQP